MVILTSWDDGHPCDRRLADMLFRHGLKGTFFVLRHNCDGRDVMPNHHIQQIGRVFEIAGHTVDHVRLDRSSGDDVADQVYGCKIWLEDLLGASICGFCYPHGRVSDVALGLVQKAGFRYARTIENLRCDPGVDPYRMPTTVQFYPHSRRVYFGNYLRHGGYSNKSKVLRTLLRERDFAQRLRDVALVCAEGCGVFHLWGHSWEIEALGLWSVLDEFLAFLSSLPHQTKTLCDLW